MLRFLGLVGSNLPYSTAKAIENPVNTVPDQFFQGAFIGPIESTLVSYNIRFFAYLFNNASHII